MDKDKYDREYGIYRSSYSEEGFSSKLKEYAKKIGLNTTYYILLLYNLLKSGVIRPSDKAIVLGALGYFISPLDLIPDVIIGTGLLDDASILLMALKILYDCINDDIKTKAKKQLKKFFTFKEDELNEQYR